MLPLHAAAAAIMFGAAIHLLLSRRALRMVLGLSLLATAINLALFQTGRLASARPPLLPADGSPAGAIADPVPQALILTAIVIGLALIVILAALALRSGSDDA